MTSLEAYNIIKEQHQSDTLVECVDLGSMFGFVLVDWDEATYGPLTRDKVYSEYIITGWETVNKETGEISTQGSLDFYNKNPDKEGNIKFVRVE